MNWTKFYNFPAITILLAVFLTGCFEENVIPLEVGAKAPLSTLTLLDGNTMEITNHPGQAQVITFMSSWCPCSNESIPLIKKALSHNNISRDGKIAFLMIGFQSPESKFVKFAAKWQIPFPVGYDDGDKIARTYGVKAPPTTIFIDTQGVVKRVFYGNIKDKEQEFSTWVSELL